MGIECKFGDRIPEDYNVEWVKYEPLGYSGGDVARR